MRSGLSVGLGMMYAWNQYSIISSWQSDSQVKDSFSGVLSSVTYFAMLLSLSFAYLSYKRSMIISGLILLAAQFVPNPILQRFVLGLGSPSFSTFTLYSNLNSSDQIRFLSYYNISSLLGVSLGLLLKSPPLFFAIFWLFSVFFHCFTKEPERAEEVYLRQLLPIYSLYFMSFISELLGELVILSMPMVLGSVWEWEAASISSLLVLAHVVAIPVQWVLTKHLYYSSRELLINSLGMCGIAASMLVSLFYDFIFQYAGGVCLSVIAAYFTRASLCFFVSRAFSSQSYLKLAAIGLFGRIIAGLTIAVIDRENHEDLNKYLFLPITIVISVSLFALRSKNHFDDPIKRD